MRTEVGQLDRALLGGRQEVLVGFRRSLEEVGVFTKPPIRSDKVAVDLIEGKTVQNSGQGVSVEPNGTDLSVNVALGFNRYASESVLLGMEETFDLNMTHDFKPVPLVRAKERFIDPLALLTEIELKNPIEIEVLFLSNFRVKAQGMFDQFPAFCTGYQQQG